VVEGAHNGKRVPGLLVATDRRVVMLASRSWASYVWLIGPLWAWVTQQLAPLNMTAQIDRDDFASVEAHGGQMLSFHSKGDGYGHISFVAYSRKPFDVWQQRMHHWATRTAFAAPIPPARLVDR
jgi:hypothetical protein